jgi:hypothetical protein
MENNNLPELRNPVHDLMLGNMPGLPQIIQNAMPVIIPQMQYNQNPVGMIFGNFKRKRIAKAYEFEAQIAEAAARRTRSNVQAITDVVTCSGGIADALGEYEHRKTMRSLEIREKESDIYIKNAQAQQIGFEAKLSELDYDIKFIQAKKMKEELNGTSTP